MDPKKNIKKYEQKEKETNSFLCIFITFLAQLERNCPYRKRLIKKKCDFSFF